MAVINETQKKLNRRTSPLAYLSGIVKFLKKNRIVLVSVLVFALAFCCIFAFAGNNSDVEEFTSSEESVKNESFEESIEESLEEPAASEDGKLYGNGVYIDGCFIAALDSEYEATTAINEILSIRVSSLGINEAEEVYFKNEVEIVYGEYPEEAYTDSEGLASLLGKKSSTYVSRYVYDYNGVIVPVTLSVCSVETYTETITLEYESKMVYTDALRDGATKVVTKGYNGEGKQTYRVVSVDGVKAETNVVSLDVITAPTAEVVQIGTRSNGKTVASLGTFQKPYDGRITSYVGPRWGRTHNGIDIVAHDGPCKGDPAYAAADGVVVRADWYGGYGNCVIIDHGNGIQTLYAHFSKLSVKVGDVVKAGDEVGKIGSTGNSTGPHLHFEVHVDGEIVNPLIFVDYE